MIDKTSWLMVGLSSSKKKERRARWWNEVVYGFDGSQAAFDRALAVFYDELEEDRN
jgi:hypothetical protein